MHVRSSTRVHQEYTTELEILNATLIYKMLPRTPLYSENYTDRIRHQIQTRGAKYSDDSLED